MLVRRLYVLVRRLYVAVRRQYVAVREAYVERENYAELGAKRKNLCEKVT